MGLTGVIASSTEAQTCVTGSETAGPTKSVTMAFQRIFRTPPLMAKLPSGRSLIQESTNKSDYTNAIETPSKDSSRFATSNIEHRQEKFHIERRHITETMDRQPHSRASSPVFWLRSASFHAVLISVFGPINTRLRYQPGATCMAQYAVCNMQSRFATWHDHGEQRHAQ